MGYSLGSLRVEGGAEVSKLISGTGWGGGLGASGGRRLHLRRREGGEDVRWMVWNWIWSSCKGIGSDRGGPWLEGSKEEETSEWGLADIVLEGFSVCLQCGRPGVS